MTGLEGHNCGRGNLFIARVTRRRFLKWWIQISVWEDLWPYKPDESHWALSEHVTTNYTPTNRTLRLLGALYKTELPSARLDRQRNRKETEREAANRTNKNKTAPLRLLGGSYETKLPSARFDIKTRQWWMITARKTTIGGSEKICAQNSEISRLGNSRLGNLSIRKFSIRKFLD